MNKLENRITLTALTAAACSIAFAWTITALQAETPKELPKDLEPAWRTETVAPLPEEAYAEAVDEPEPVVEVEPETTSLGEFKLTAYCTCSKCCGQWADGITYTGTQATAGRTIAVDPDVIPLGSTVIINGTEYIAEDVGGAIKGNRIDVLFNTHQEALEFGIQYADVTIKK